MTPDTFATAGAILTRLEAAYRESDISAYGRLNWEFHHSLYRPSARIQTLTLVHSVNVQTDRYIRLQLVLAGRESDAEQEHRQLLKLCQAQQVASAVMFLREHILDAGERLKASLQQHRDGAVVARKRRRRSPAAGVTDAASLPAKGKP